MRKSRFVLAALLSAMSLLSACKKDGKADDSWKEIPNTLFTAETGTATLNVNSIPVSIGSVKLVASSKAKAVLTMNNVIPCCSSVKVDVDLTESSDSVWSFSGYGVIDKMSVLSVKNETPYIYEVSVYGTLRNCEKITVNADMLVAKSAEGGMSGSWNLLRESSIGAGGMPAITPLQITWTASGEYAVKAATMATAFSILGSVELADELDQITLYTDGNITAKFWADGSDSDEQMQIPDIQELLKSLIGPDMKYHFNATSHTDWLEVPKVNLAFWYTSGSYLFAVPNLAAISETGTTITVSDIYAAVEEFKAMGVDTKQLISVLDTFLDKGVVFKFSVDGSSMSLIIDKSLCGDLVNAFLPVLKQLDVLIENMDNNPDLDEETKAELMTLKTLLAAFGLEKPSDLITVWENTTEFTVKINFTKAE